MRCRHHGPKGRLIGVVVGFRLGRFLEGNFFIDWHVDGFNPIPYKAEDLILAENGIERARKAICASK